MRSSAPGPLPPDTSLAYNLWTYLHLGQSWVVNQFDAFSVHGFDPQSQRLIAAYVTSMGLPNPVPGPLPNGAGVNLPGSVIGFTGYASTDLITVGRCAVLAENLWEAANGYVPAPKLEICTGYPGSTWTSGGGGGLAPGPTLVGASISGNTLTVASTPSDGVVAAGQWVNGTGITVNKHAILAYGSGGTSGTGGAGTYQIGVIAHATGTATVSNGSSGSGNILSVSAIASGAIVAGDLVNIAGLPAGATVASFGTGGTTGSGGTGTYQLSQSALISTGIAFTSGAGPGSIGPATLTANGVSWTNMQSILSQISTLAPPYRFVGQGLVNKLFAPTYKRVGYIQGGSTDATLTGKLYDLGDATNGLIARMDGLNIAPAGTLKYDLSHPAEISNTTTANVSDYGTIAFARTHAPGAGGAYSGRVFLMASAYPWPFSGINDTGYGNIHTGPYGSARHGEIIGLARFQMNRLGIPWTPLWLSLTNNITVSGNTITIPFDKPSGPFFTGNLVWLSDANDGIKVWPNYGFSVSGPAGSISNVAIVGSTVVITWSTTIMTGTAATIGYCQVGPGGNNPGLCTGVGGNLAIVGPPSVLFPSGTGAGATANAWAIPFTATVTAS